MHRVLPLITLALLAAGTAAQAQEVQGQPVQVDTVASSDPAAAQGAAPAPAEAQAAPADTTALPQTAPAPTAAEAPDTKKAPVLAGFEFGKGVTVRSADDRFSMTIRGRVQLRFTVESDATDTETPTDLFFQVRRARLLFQGNFFSEKLQYYVQLGMAPLDMEADLLVPVRDAYITYAPLRDLNLRAGQMKVPFNRERVISSSALQLVDRSIVNAELTLDRDVGVQLFSNDVGGLGGRLGYQVGVFGGEGRNRFGEGTGLLYVARLQVQPLGEFKDSYSEGGFTHDKRPRLSVGGGFAFNDDSTRQRSTSGSFYEQGSYDTMHAEADLMFKAGGFSLMSEFLWRSTNPSLRTGVDADGAPVEELGRSGLGWMAQAGYAIKTVDVAIRWAELHPLVDVPTALELTREGTVGAGWFIKGHDLKLQADYSFAFGEDATAMKHTGRVQTQVYF